MKSLATQQKYTRFNRWSNCYTGQNHTHALSIGIGTVKRLGSYLFLGRRDWPGDVLFRNIFHIFEFRTHPPPESPLPPPPCIHALGTDIPGITSGLFKFFSGDVPPLSTWISSVIARANVVRLLAFTVLSYCRHSPYIYTWPKFTPWVLCIPAHLWCSNLSRLLHFFQFTLQIYMRQMNLLIQIGDLIVVAPEPHGALAEYILIHCLYVVGTRVIECLQEVL